MEHIRIFEDFSSDYKFKMGKSSSWPKKKHQRSARILRELNPMDNMDYREIVEYIEDVQKKFGWFAEWKNKIPEPDLFRRSDVFFFDVLRPDGKTELIFFDGGDYESEEPGYGYMSTETMDGKYSMHVSASRWGDDVEIIDPVDLYWD